MTKVIEYCLIILYVLSLKLRNKIYVFTIEFFRKDHYYSRIYKCYILWTNLIYVVDVEFCVHADSLKTHFLEDKDAENIYIKN